MSDWDLIMIEAEKIARQLRQQATDLNEAQKIGDYYMKNDYDEDKMSRYLTVLAKNPPIRSKRSQRHYRNIRDIWERWRSHLSGQDKARAWGWAIRLAKVGW